MSNGAMVVAAAPPSNPVRGVARKLVPFGARTWLKLRWIAAKAAAARMRERLAWRPSLYDLSTPERVGVAIRAPSDMLVHERIFLYGLVRGIRPQRVLEIGVFKGGSSAVMAAAMEDAGGEGRIVGIDPYPAIEVAPRDYFGRFTLVKDTSPEGIGAAMTLLGGPADLVFIDALHTHDAVVKDLTGVLPHLAPGAYVLLHDAFHYGIDRAVKAVLATDSRLVDCGYVCGTPRIPADAPTPYNGLRMLRRADGDDWRRLVGRCYAERGEAMPEFDDEILNHDSWWCRKYEPCPRCKKEQAKQV